LVDGGPEANNLSPLSTRSVVGEFEQFDATTRGFGGALHPSRLGLAWRAFDPARKKARLFKPGLVKMMGDADQRDTTTVVPTETR
jgi:hypothetical protein